MTGRNHLLVLVIFALLPALTVICVTGCTKEREVTGPSASEPGETGDASGSATGGPNPATLQEVPSLDDPGKGTSGEGLSGPSFTPPRAKSPVPPSLDAIWKAATGAAPTPPGPPTLADDPITPTKWILDLEKQKRLFREHLKKGEDILDFFSSPAQDIDPKSVGIKPNSVIADIGTPTSGPRIPASAAMVFQSIEATRERSRTSPPHRPTRRRIRRIAPSSHATEEIFTHSPRNSLLNRLMLRLSLTRRSCTRRGSS